MAIHCDVCGGCLFSAQENYDGFKVDDSFVSNCPYNKDKKSVTNTCYDCYSIINKEIAAARAHVINMTMQAINNIRSK